MRIRYKLILVSLLLPLVTCVVGYYAISAGQAALKDQLNENSAQFAEEILRTLAHRVDNQMAEWHAFFERVDMVTMLEASNSEFEKLADVDRLIEERDKAWRAAEDGTYPGFANVVLDSAVSRDLRERQELLAGFHGYQSCAEVIVTNRYGVNVGQTGWTTDYRQSDEGWWVKAAEKHVHVGSVEYDASAGIDSIDLCLGIHRTGGTLVGVAKVVYDVSTLTSQLHVAGEVAEALSSEHTHIVLLDGDGRIVFASHDPEATGQSGERYLAAFDDGVYGERVDEELGVMWASKADDAGDAAKVDFGWTVVIEQQRASVLAPMRVLAGRIWSLVSVGCGAALLVSLWFSFSLSRRLLHLSKAAQELRLGKLDVVIEDKHHDELTELGRTLEATAESFQQVADVCEQVALGDFGTVVSLRSKDDRLGISVNSMAMTLQAVAHQAGEIAEGNYSNEVAPRSENDELGRALAGMTQSLRQKTEENAGQTWLMEGQAELNTVMRGDQDVQQLAEVVIRTLAKHVESPLGALYLMEDNGRLKLYGSYAYSFRKHGMSEFAPGEGLVGQAALEKQSILISQVPDGYVEVVSGLGSGTPRQVLVAPCVHEGEVQAVIELGRLTPFNELQLTLVEKVAEAVAIAINSAQARRQVEELLIETQRQSESLQAQEEELRASNGELERQTQDLQKSQEHLRQQQEQLEHVNSELEQKTESLEQQKSALEQARRQLELRSEQLEQASTYKTEFLSNMSHELRTPLNSLLILSKMLAEDASGNMDEEQTRSAGIIHQSGQDLLTLINEILDLSKIEAGKMEIHPEPVAMGELEVSLQQRFTHMAEQKGIFFAVEVAEGTPEQFETDPLRLEQVLRNLLSNAIKFTSQGGVTVGVKRQGDCLWMGVTDTGIGIAPEKQKLIFEAFQQADGTTSREYGGTGLGLTICRKLVGMLGGKLTLESVEGEGSTFSFALPLKGAKGKATKAQVRPEQTSDDVAAAATANDADGEERSRRILIIEDDEVFAAMVAQRARDKGFEAQTAKDGEEGLQLARQIRPDAIVLDVGLPGINGWQVLERLRNDAALSQVPVHFLSAGDERAKALEQGAVGYLTKPVTEEHLMAALDKLAAFAAETSGQVLLVEDDPGQQQSVVQLLQRAGAEVAVAGTGAAAREMLATGTYQCVVLDLGLPDMSGFEVLKTMRETGRTMDTPVVVYSGKDLTAEENEQLQEYAESVIIKGTASGQRLLDEVTLFLHRVEADMPQEQKPVAATPPSRDAVLEGKTVLVVDDDMRNVFALSHALKDKGMDVKVAHNGQQALDVLGELEQVDAVLMDIMMPVMDGYEAMRAIRQQEQFAALPILALTAKAMPEDRSVCLEAGASDYLPKPVDLDKVLSMLRVWLYEQVTV